MPSSSRMTVLTVGTAAAVMMSAGAAAQNIVMAIPAPSLTFAANFIAHDAGYYKKEGLNVTDRSLVGVASTNAVIAGSADFTMGTGATMLRAVANGQKLFAIATLVDKPLAELVLRKDVADAAKITEQTPVNQRLAVLKGKTIAIQGVGSIIHATQRLAARRVGLDPDKDVRIAPMDPPAMLPALKAKKIDGFATSLPFTTQPVVEGEAIMLLSTPRGDLPEYVPFDYVVLYTRPEVCEKERVKCEKVARALKGATQFIVQKPAEAGALLQKHFAKMDRKVFDAAWDVVSKAHSKTSMPTLQGLENSQKYSIDAGLLEPKDQLKDIRPVFTDAFVK